MFQAEPGAGDIATQTPSSYLPGVIAEIDGDKIQRSADGDRAVLRDEARRRSPKAVAALQSGRA